MKKSVTGVILTGVIILAGIAGIFFTKFGKPGGEDSGDSPRKEISEGNPQQVSAGYPEQETEGEPDGVPEAEGDIDFAALQRENPDIFAWIRVPGTNIDYPILQSPVQDDYYKTRGIDGNPDPDGCLYTEMANMMNMCDFNTVIHGSANDNQTMFSELRKYENPEFFAEQEIFYIYLPDNRLTYEILAAYPYSGGDILRSYNLTEPEGCSRFLEDVYQTREMGMNLRENFERPTPYHFLVSLLAQPAEEGENPYLVIGVLTADEAGTIDRLVY